MPTKKTTVHSTLVLAPTFGLKYDLGENVYERGQVVHLQTDIVDRMVLLTSELELPLTPTRRSSWHFEGAEQQQPAQLKEC